MSEWVVTRSETRTQFYVGIEAPTAAGALVAFFAGDGELDPEATDWSEAKIEARRASGATSFKSGSGVAGG